MERTDYVTRAAPWVMAQIADDVSKALSTMVNQHEIDRMHRQAMSGRLCDIEDLIDIRPYVS